MIKKLLTTLITITMTALPITKVSAHVSDMTNGERSLGRSMELSFYDPYGYNSTNACLAGTPTLPNGNIGQPSGSVSIDHTTAFLDRWHDTAVELQILFGIPWEGAMVQAAVESDWGRDPDAISHNVYFAVNAFNTNPDAAYKYPTPELSWFGSSNPPSYAEYIRGHSNYINQGAFNHVGDPLGYLTAIARGGYAVPNDYDEQIAAGKQREDILYEHYFPLLSNVYTNFVHPYAEQQGWLDSAGVAAANPESVANAEQNSKGNGISAAPSYGQCPPGTVPANPITGSATDGLPFNLNDGPIYTTDCMGGIRDGAAHGAIDFGFNNREGVPLFATMDGTVDFVGTYPPNQDHGGYGYYIILNYGNGVTAIYGHLQSGSAVVSVGDSVKKGQPVARSGNTGWSTGPHLHYEIRQNGKKINPLGFLGDISTIDRAGCTR